MNLPRAAFPSKLNAKQKWMKKTLLRNKHEELQDEEGCKAKKESPIGI